MSIWVAELTGRCESIPAPEDWLDDTHLIEAVRGLSGREQRVLYLRLHLGLSQREVARILGLEQRPVGRNQGTQIVSRLEVNAIRRLRILLSQSMSGASQRWNGTSSA